MLNITVQTDEESGLCPARNVLSSVTGKWSSLILLSLEGGPQRFSGMKKIIGDITQRVLTENLRTLERDGYVTRTVMSGPPIVVSYALTKTGVEVVGFLRPLVLWAEAHFPQVQENRAAYDKAQP